MSRNLKFKLMNNTQLAQVVDYTKSDDGYVCLAIKTGLKKCSCCTYIKPLSDFHKSNWSTDGAQYYCKNCSKSENKKLRNLKLFQKIAEDYHNNLGQFA